jgi:MFS transporter, PAT family, beta-lactamase induction signal transducer AmpG
LTTETARRPTPPFLFLILELPFGAAVGFLQIAVPFWLRAAGIDLDTIAAISGTGFLPHALKLFWVPLLDLGAKRRTWYLVMVALTAVLLATCSLVPDPAHHIGLLTALLTAAQATAATAASALNALMATTSREGDKARAGGYQMAGNVGGTALLGTLPIWLLGRSSPAIAGLVLGGIVLACGLAARFIDEIPTEPLHGPVLPAVTKRIATITRDLWITAKSREGWTGLAICFAPIGCGALTNLFSGMAIDFHASEYTVGLTNGLWGGIVSALGSIVGGFLGDRMNRRVAYCLAGALTATVAIAMGLSPMTEVTYTWGVLAYSFTNGIAFAAFAGLVLEMVSHGTAVATKYALFVAVSNQAISYVTRLDGHASTFIVHGKPWGTAGVVLFDAIITIAGIVALGLLMLALRLQRDPSPGGARPSAGTPSRIVG